MNEDLRQHVLRAKEYLNALPGSVQSVAILLLVTLAILTVVLARTEGDSDSHEPLFSGRRLSQPELQRMEAALGAAQLSDYRVEDARLFAPSGQRSKYMSAIEAAGHLPESFHAPTEDAIRSTSLIELGPQHAKRLHHADEQEARLAVCAIPGIEDAFVHFDETKAHGFGGQRETTAGVGVQTSPGFSLDLETFQMIQTMMLGFKAGLRPEQITITDLNARRSFRGSTSQGASSATTRAMLQRSLERRWQQRVRSTLSFIPNLHVAVAVQLPRQAGADAEGHDVRVSVSVPTSYLLRVLDARRGRATAQPNSSASSPTLRDVEEQTFQKIRMAILPILPRSSAGTAADRVVTVTSFDDPVALTKAEPAAVFRPSIRLSPISVVAAIAGLGAGLLILRRWFRSERPETEPPRLRVVAESAGSEEQRAGAGDGGGGQSLHQQLQTLVEEDPEAAVQSLAQWIDKAG